ncbi:hypothetical protein PgNI_11406 [Pyricularia grisea]|uniref:Uncharacterized protein n=1 Tax=Pyricularia grisea TaxID=148305 RepID=A0A6P8APL1_PYRGI|nr:hypothetical protein PgNI_11406 [Pyricularia grisea]TLD03970.1 hypothetical protein PgNI_11406 [Pyricularia grisea]
MSKLSEEEKLVVTQELIKHVAKLKKLGSNKPGFRGVPEKATLDEIFMPDN